jgi:hypothetical protein
MDSSQKEKMGSFLDGIERKRERDFIHFFSFLFISFFLNFLLLFQDLIEFIMLSKTETL